MPKSFAEKINKAKLLVEAMRNNKETLPKPLTEEFIEDLAKKVDLAAELNSVQEKLKADLKTQTARLDTLRKRPLCRCQEAYQTRLRQRTMGRVRLRRQEVKLSVKKG